MGAVAVGDAEAATAKGGGGRASRGGYRGRGGLGLRGGHGGGGGYDDPSILTQSSLASADIPMGIRATRKCLMGWPQILVYMNFCEVSRAQAPVTGIHRRLWLAHPVLHGLEEECRAGLRPTVDDDYRRNGHPELRHTPATPAGPPSTVRTRGGIQIWPALPAMMVIVGALGWTDRHSLG